MAFTDFAPAAHSAAPLTASRIFRAVVAWFAAYRAARARRIALASLLDMDAYRLDDLGITPQDIVEALNNPTRR